MIEEKIAEILNRFGYGVKLKERKSEEAMLMLPLNREETIREILSLLPQEGWIDMFDEEGLNVYEKRMRERGWLHKDDKVEGLEAEVDCEECANTKQECPMRYVKPLTIAEALEKMEEMVKVCEWADSKNEKDCSEIFNCKVKRSDGCNSIECPVDNALTLRDGRRIR